MGKVRSIEVSINLEGEWEEELTYSEEPFTPTLIAYSAFWNVAKGGVTMYAYVHGDNACAGLEDCTQEYPDPPQWFYAAMAELETQYSDLGENNFPVQKRK